MSDRLQLWSLGETPGFKASARFAAPPPAVAMPEVEAEDPLARAYAEGHAVGIAEERARAAEAAAADAAAREVLTFSFARLDRQLEEELRLRLRDTVAALCETSLAPLALDEEALARRIETAVSMLARADDERVIRLNPEDIPLVSARLAEDWQVVPDPALERGALRVESTNGGVEDGPASWRRAIAEALRTC